jgi:glutathione S-transferase
MIKLYDFEWSGNCYKVRLLMGILGMDWQTTPIGFHPLREHKWDWFLKINPLGQIPVIEDDGFILRDAQAILAYLASKYDASGTWYPRGDPALLGEIQQWLAFADAITGTASAARLQGALSYDLDIEAARNGAHNLFRILDEHLWFREQEGRDFICATRHPTIADIACFPYVMLSEEGGISRQDYPTIRRWCDRVKRIKGFVTAPGIFPGSPAKPIESLALSA